MFNGIRLIEPADQIANALRVRGKQKTAIDIERGPRRTRWIGQSGGELSKRTNGRLLFWSCLASALGRIEHDDLGADRTRGIGSGGAAIEFPVCLESPLELEQHEHLAL